MAKVDVGVMGQAQLNAGMGGLTGNSTPKATAATWSFIVFGMAVAFILFIYFGFGGLRGSVAS